jgi:osmotically-inducible protein OsmY
MDRYDDRTPLWDYQDNSVPDDGRRQGWGRDRAEDAARAYTAVEDRDRSRRDERRPYSGQADRNADWNRQRETSYGGRRDQDSRYERGARYEDAVGAARSADGDRGGWNWPGEFGYPPERGYEPYGYERSHRSTGRDDERGFLDRAGDEVRSWFGDRDARHRREEDHRGRGPKNYARSDERIREDVNDRLTEDVWIDASEIEVTVEGGEVTLSGTVADRSIKRRAEDCADAVSGVKHVQNNLRYTSGVVSPKIA